MLETVRKTLSGNGSRWLLCLAVTCVLYGLAVLSMTGWGSIFNYFYLLLGVSLLLCLFLERNCRSRRLRKIIKTAFLTILILFSAVMVRIAVFPFAGRDNSPEYVILLGSGVNRDGRPSRDFAGRIDAAYEQLTKRPNVKVICTGGKGRNEPMAEAQCAAKLLEEKGIASSRIIIEDGSFSTRENIQNAVALIEGSGRQIEDCPIMIVSSCFHLYRGAMIARQVGFTDICVSPSIGTPFLLPQYFAREVFALFKDGVLYRLGI